MSAKTSSAFVELPIKSAKRKQLNPGDRLKHCEQWRRSGLSMNEYSRRHDLSVSSLSQWVARLSKSVASSLPPTQVATQPTLPSLEKHRLEIILPSGIRLGFPTMIDAASVVGFIKVLEGLCK